MGKPLEDMGRLRGAVLWRDPAAGLCAPQLGRRFQCAATVVANSLRLAFALFSAAMAFAEPALFLRFAKSPLKLLDAIQPSAYGIFLVHYIFIIWLQYALYDPPLPALVKFALVFAGTLALSWGLVVLLRKIPFVARMI